MRLATSLGWDYAVYSSRAQSQTTMANRAYLYAMSGANGWWDRMEERDYFDSRWTIPICWWLLFDAASIRVVDCHGGDWQEIRLARNRSESITSLESRAELVRDIIKDRVPESRFRFFVDVLQHWPDPILAMDPEEVLGGSISCSDEENLANFRSILDALDDPALSSHELEELTRPYSPNVDDPEEAEARVFGYTYGELANELWRVHCEA
jgi:hypothetical protein